MGQPVPTSADVIEVALIVGRGPRVSGGQAFADWVVAVQAAKPPIRSETSRFPWRRSMLAATLERQPPAQ